MTTVRTREAAAQTLRRPRIFQEIEARNAGVLMAWEEELRRQRKQLEADRRGLASQVRIANWLFKTGLLPWLGFFCAVAWMVCASVELLPGGKEAVAPAAMLGVQALFFSSGWVVFFVNRKLTGDALTHSGGIAEWASPDGEERAA